MPDKWEVERAVLDSKLEPLARLLMLAMLAKADAKTAVIKPEHTPSLTTMCEMTGMGRSSVVEWLDILEAAGWVKRIKPEKKTRDTRTQYALLKGAAEAHRPARASRIPKERRAGAHSGPPAERTADHSKPESPQSGSAHSGPSSEPSSAHSAPPVVRTADPSSPHSAPATIKSSPTENSHHQEPPSSAPPAPPADEAPETTQTILKAFIDYCDSQDIAVPKRLVGQYAKLIKEHLDQEKITPLMVRKALWGMFRDNVVNRPTLLPNRIVQEQMGPERRNGKHQTHQNRPAADYKGVL